MKVPNVKKLIQQVQASLKKSDSVLRESKLTLKNVQKDIEGAEKKHALEQKTIDNDIVKIVQDMDRATIQLVKDTE